MNPLGAALAVALLAASQPAADRVLLVAPRAPANRAVVALSAAIGSQLGRHGRHTVVPETELRKALAESKGPAELDLDDPGHVTLALELVKADSLLQVISSRTLLVRSARRGAPSGRLVATAGGEPKDVALDLVRQLERPAESPVFTPPAPLPRIGERVLLELQVLGGGELSARKNEYGVSLGFEAPFSSRWAVAGNIGLRLGTVTCQLRDERDADGPAVGELDSSFRLPVAIDLRWSFLKSRRWQAQAAFGVELAYVGLSDARAGAPADGAAYELESRPTSFGFSAGPSLALQLGFAVSERIRVRLGARYVAAFEATKPVVAGTVQRSADEVPEPARFVPTKWLRHELHALVAIDLVF